MDNTSVADRVVQMHSNIDSIRQCVRSLSETESHDAEMECLNAEQEAKIKDKAAQHQIEPEKLAEKWKKKDLELAEKRRKEEDESMGRR